MTNSAAVTGTLVVTTLVVLALLSSCQESVKIWELYSVSAGPQGTNVNSQGYFYSQSECKAAAYDLERTTAGIQDASARYVCVQGVEVR